MLAGGKGTKAACQSLARFAGAIPQEDLAAIAQAVEAAVAALDSNVWELVVAEERPRAVAGTGVDAVIRARRRT